MHRRVKQCLAELGAQTDLDWVPARGGVHVQLAQFPGARSVKVQFLMEEDHLFIKAMIMEAKAFRRLFPQKEREFKIASFIWQTNTRNELVAIGLSEEGDLIAGIHQPINTLDPEELRTYVNSVASYADRLAQVLKEEKIEN